MVEFGNENDIARVVDWSRVMMRYCKRDQFVLCRRDWIEGIIRVSASEERA
jgi:hypothetical protein